MQEFIQRKNTVLFVKKSFYLPFLKVELKKPAQINVGMNYCQKSFQKKELVILESICGQKPNLELQMNVSIVGKLLQVIIYTGQIFLENIKRIHQTGLDYVYHVIQNMTVHENNYIQAV